MAEPLTEREIFGALHLWHPMSNISWAADLAPQLLELPGFTPYLSQISNTPIIEIGPGYKPITEYFPCEEYKAAEAHPGNDGLSVLRKEKDRSAVIVSFGVIDDDVLLNKRNAGSQQLTERYIDELVGQILRVMNPFALILGGDAEKYMGKPVVAFEFLGEYTCQSDSCIHRL